MRIRAKQKVSMEIQAMLAPSFKWTRSSEVNGSEQWSAVWPKGHVFDLINDAESFAANKFLADGLAEEIE